MAKAKKMVKLGVNVAENLISSNQWTKIGIMIREEKFSVEAVRYIIDKNQNNVFEAMTKYNFKDIFSSFEDYINSKAAKSLYDDGESNYMFEWFGYFPSNSEELMELYNKQDTEYMKTLIFKNIIYRDRNYRMGAKVREQYLNCFDAIFELTKAEYNPDTIEALTYMMVWSEFVSVKWAEKCEELVGREETIKIFLKRLDMREDYMPSSKGVVDALEIYDYLKVAMENPDSTKLPLKPLIKICSPADWYSVPKTEQDTIYIPKAKEIYARHLRPFVVKSLKDVYMAIRNNSSKVSTAIHVFEEDESIINLAFSYACKQEGLQTAIQDLFYIVSRGIEVKFTPIMAQVSEIQAVSWNSVIISEKLTNAEEVIAYKERVFPFSHKIDSFCLNPLMSRNFKLGEFEKSDVDAIAAYLNWDNIDKYFDSQVVPFEFLMVHREKINRLNFKFAIFQEYTTEQIVEVLEVFANKMDTTCLPNIVSHLCLEKAGLTEETAAKLLKQVPFLDIRVEKAENTKLDLQSILTLI